MSGWLIDTNVLSELRRPRPRREVVAFIAAQPLESLHVSSVTLAEIRFGIDAVADATKRADLSDWLTHRLRPMFVGRVLEVSEDVMFIWRQMVERRRRQGHTFSQPDLLIVATARCHGLAVVTRDVSEFMHAGVEVVNPWGRSL